MDKFFVLLGENPLLWGQVCHLRELGYKVILVAWSIAFFEYCLMVPANRIGYGQFNATQLKTIQEVITLTVFSFFSILYLHESFKWNYIVGFIFIVLAVFFIFYKW